MDKNEAIHITKFKSGFTLSEILIVLFLIGVVSILVLPNFITFLNQRILKSQTEVFNKKLTEGFQRMRVDNILENKYTTSSFINEMKKYFNIAVVCNNNNLSACFPAPEIKYRVEDDYGIIKVSDLKTSEDFKSLKYQTVSDIYGLKFADSTSMLITVNPDCIGPSDDETTNNNTVLFKCVNYIFDVNGIKSPNTIDTKGDMQSNIAFEIENDFGLSFKIYGPPVNAPSVDSRSFANDELNKYGIKNRYNGSWGNRANDYWAGAVVYCYNIEPKGTWKLPSKEQLKEISDLITGSCVYTGYCRSTGGTYAFPNPALREFMGGVVNSSSALEIWGSYEKDAGSGSSRVFDNTSTHEGGAYRSDSHIKTICVK